MFYERFKPGMKPDRRYEDVKCKMEDGRIKTWDEIFLHIPATVVALDMGMEIDAWTIYVQNPGRLNLVHLLDLSGFFNVPYLVMTRLIGDKIREQERNMTPQERRQSDGQFLLAMIEKNVDLPKLMADIESKIANLPK